MIQSKADLKHYLEQDRIALYKTRKKPRIAGDEIWRNSKEFVFHYSAPCGRTKERHVFFVVIPPRKPPPQAETPDD